MNRRLHKAAEEKIYARYRRSSGNALFRWVNNEPQIWLFGLNRWEKLADWPEDAGWSEASRTRVIEAIELAHRAQDLLLQTEEVNEDAETRGVELEDSSPELAPILSELREVLGQLNGRLKKYPHYYSVWPGGIVPGRLTMASMPPLNSTVCRGEQLAIDDLRTLVNEGEICNLAECDCGRFFYALKDDQRSCSAKCRHKLYENKPEAKEQRREYMREYYKLKKSGKVR